jgi:hypothetical protein
MSWIRALIAIVLAGFLALTVRALLHYSYIGFLEAATANAVVSVILFDLVICLGLIAVWIHRDARNLGISPWPYIALGACLGVAGPLLYLLRRPRCEPSFGDEPRNAWRVLLPTLILFTAATLFAIYQYGYLSFLVFAAANEATQLLFVDLALSLTLVAVWMVRDARARNAPYLPFLAVGFFFGSVGPLAYLLTRGWERSRQRLAGALAVAAGAFAMTLGSGYADLRSGSGRGRTSLSEIHFQRAAVENAAFDAARPDALRSRSRRRGDRKREID